MRTLGVGIDAVNIGSATQTAMDWIATGKKSYVAVTGVHGVIEAQYDPDFKRILNETGLCVPDGMPLVWLLKQAKHKEVGRVFGPDWMLDLCQALAAEKRSVFYYGGKPGVAEELAKKMEEDYPGIRTVGTICPPFRAVTADEKAQYVSIMNEADPDVIWVGLSTPKQERWMAEYRPLLNARVLIGVGAAFDYNTGKLQRAPRWVQQSGMEWLYRLILEPRRLWRRYLRNNPMFLYYLFLEKTGLRRFDQPGEAQAS